MILGGTIDIPYKDGDEFSVWPIGCLHIGAKGHTKKTLKRVIGSVKDDPNALWVGLGDYADCISYNDPRFDPISIGANYKIEQLATLGNAQMVEVAGVLKPIKEKCLGLLTGNHELKYDLRFYNDLQGWLCTELGTTNLGYCGIFVLRFYNSKRRKSFRIKVFTHHGAGSSSRKLKDFMKQFDADLYFMAHIHKLDEPVITLRTETCDFSGTRRLSRDKVGIICPSYLDAYHADKANKVHGVRPSYAEKAGYMPTALGTGIRAMINPAEKTIGFRQ